MSNPQASVAAGPRTDLTRYGYSRIDRRDRRRLPGGKSVALWIATNHEFYELTPPLRQSRPGWPRVEGDVLNYSLRDYGNRVAVWRLFDLASALGVRLSVSQNVAMIDHHPEIAQECVARGWELFAHGVYNTRYVCDLSQEEERELISDCISTIEDVTGIPPVGWLGPALSNTPATLDLLAECGFRYTCDLFHDDQPTRLRTSGGTLISLPYTLDLNDFTVFVGRKATPEEYVRSLLAQLHVLVREAEEEESYRVMCAAIHPYLVDQPHRHAIFAKALEDMVTHEGVWVATGREIADWFVNDEDEARSNVDSERGRP